MSSLALFHLRKSEVSAVALYSWGYYTTWKVVGSVVQQWFDETLPGPSVLKKYMMSPEAWG